MLDNTPNQSTTFRRKNMVEINEESRGTYIANCKINFKTSMSRSSLCDYSDPWIYICRWNYNSHIALTAGREKNIIQVAFKNCVPFTNCINEINNTQIDNAKDINVVILMHNLIECSDNYSKKSGSLRQYYRDEIALNKAGALANPLGNSASFKCKKKKTKKKNNNRLNKRRCYKIYWNNGFIEIFKYFFENS